MIDILLDQSHSEHFQVISDLLQASTTLYRSRQPLKTVRNERFCISSQMDQIFSLKIDINDGNDESPEIYMLFSVLVCR